MIRFLLLSPLIPLFIIPGRQHCARRGKDRKEEGGRKKGGINEPIFESSEVIASLIKLIVFSKLLLLVLGLVIVVPSELCRP